MRLLVILSVLLLATGVLSRRRPVVVVRRVVHNHYNVRPLAPIFRPRPRFGAGALGALVGLAAVSTDFVLDKCAMSHIHGPHKRAAPRSAVPFIPPELVDLFLAGLSS